MLLRLLFLAAIALLLVPHPGVVQTVRATNDSQVIKAKRVPIAIAAVGAVRIVEAWHLESPNTAFGSLSAMALVGPRQFLFASDNSVIVQFTLASDGGIQSGRIANLDLGMKVAHKWSRDLESLAVDRTSGKIWFGFEHRHRIMRYPADLSGREGRAFPAEMQIWNANGGAEALARFPDGQMLVMAETSDGPRGGSDALLFERDPVGDRASKPLRFAYDRQGKGRVTDATVLPDGRILILHRQISLFGGWTSTLAVADPAEITAGSAWRSQTIARFASPGINENFEGVATLAHGDGVTIWMVSDDNLARWQRTLLLQLEWDGNTVSGDGTPS